MERVTWQIDSLSSIGGRVPEVLGGPTVKDREAAVAFDGAGDALVLDVNPVGGFEQFTLEAELLPFADGAEEQRFVHIQEDGSENRILLELRMTPGGRWYGDTFINSDEHELALNDPDLTHPANEWSTLALVCNGRHMIQYVNGAKELEGDISFRPQGRGRTSIGMRINRVSWFRGMVRRVRISPCALTPDRLMTGPDPAR